MDTWAWVSGDGKFFGYTRSLKDAKGHTQRHGGGVISKNADVMMDENNRLWLKLRTSKEKAWRGARTSVSKSTGTGS